MSSVPSPRPADTEQIAQLKRQLDAYLTSHFHVSELHYTALLLDPRQKDNRTLMSDDERSRSVASLKAMVAAEVEDDTEASTSTGEQYKHYIYNCYLIYSL